ncbi:hypothetical protein NDK50_31780 [Paraburkholderia bryophila]|uniref:hypothetical protein n=1 Tax=Paraburkholderia bryophila TaxID=420952 RepID=UPI0023493DFA|nr:hypothetical protein [Paraburkholderia bryophila]WCM22583.1 hypothetical protein NDK50_31780 [Paraburkholderia bryophila]
MVNTFYTSEIDSGCLQLFNDLCEQKALLPLAYLLHAWPIHGPTDASLRRLREALKVLAELSDSELTSPNRRICKALFLKLERSLCDFSHGTPYGVRPAQPG